MIWTQGVIELLRWRQQRKAMAAQAALLIAETEQFLAQAQARPADPPSGPAPRPEPPRLG